MGAYKQTEGRSARRRDETVLELTQSCPLRRVEQVPEVSSHGVAANNPDSHLDSHLDSHRQQVAPGSHAVAARRVLVAVVAALALRW